MAALSEKHGISALPLAQLRSLGEDSVRLNSKSWRTKMQPQAATTLPFSLMLSLGLAPPSQAQVSPSDAEDGTGQ